MADLGTPHPAAHTVLSMGGRVGERAGAAGLALSGSATRSSNVCKDIHLRPARQVQRGAVGQEVETRLGEFRAALAR